MRLFVTWVSCGTDRHEHAVTDEEYVRALTGGRAPRTLCGHGVTTLSLASPPGGRCRRCRSLHDAGRSDITPRRRLQLQRLPGPSAPAGLR